MTNFLLAEGGGASSIIWLIILIAMVVIMLVLPSISQKKKLAAYQEMQNRLKAGDKVQTIGGIVGKINRIKEKDGVRTVLIETGDKSNKMVIEFDINAIAGVVEGINPTPKAEEAFDEDHKIDENDYALEDKTETSEEADEQSKPVEEKEKKATSKKKK